MKNSFYTRHSLGILLVVAFLFPFAGTGALRALKSNRNDLKQWLPDRYEETRIYQQFQKHFEGEEFILASWEGCTLDDQRLTLLVDKLDKANATEKNTTPALFSQVISGPTVLEQMTQAPINLTRNQAIERLRGSLIGPNGSQTCLVATLSTEGKKNLRRTVGQFAKMAAEECDISRDELHMGGPPIDNVAIDEAGEQSLLRLAALSGCIGLTVSWWSLRSWRLIAMVMFTGIYAIFLSMAVVWYTGAEMNAILLSMPTLVYVTATSGAIHLANYYRDTVDEEGAEGAAERAIHHAWLPLSLATGTTAVGLLSLCYSELVPIRLFGLYSAIGVVVSLLLLFFFLPAALARWPATPRPRPAEGDGMGHTAMGRWWWSVGQSIVRHHALVTVSSLLVMAFCLYGVQKIQTSVSLMRFFNKDARILHDYAWLEEHLGELVPMEIVVAVDEQKAGLDMLQQMELVERVQSAVNQIPEIGSSLSSVTFAPPLNAKPKRRSGGIAGVLDRVMKADKVERNVRAKRLASHREEFLKSEYLREVDGKLMWRICARVGALKDVNYAHFVDVLKQHVEPIVANEGSPGISVSYTGLVPIVYKAQNSLLDGMVFGYMSDLALIILVMIIAVRSFSAGLLLTITSIFPALVVFGGMGWMGLLVSVGTVMTPAVALGVTVDDVVHFMLWFRRGIGEGLDRPAAVMLAYKGCARAMYQSWGVIGLGLSVFIFSPFTPTQSFGWLMLTLLTAALPGNLLLLPALLAGPMGALFAGRIKRAEPIVETTAVPQHHRPLEARRRRDAEPVGQSND